MERVLLVGVSLDNEEDTIESLAELAELTKTAGRRSSKRSVSEQRADTSGNLCGKRKVRRD